MNFLPPPVNDHQVIARILFKILEWAWIGIVGMVVHLYRKLIGLDTQHQILQEARTCNAMQRKEDLDRHDSQRTEMMDAINRHNDQVMHRLDSLEKTVRNGH